MSPSTAATMIAPRQTRAKKTRDALLGAVERIVAAEGAEAVTTTRIAVETGVAVGTIYRYFDGREALLLSAYDATVARIVASCGAIIVAAVLGDISETLSSFLTGRKRRRIVG